MESISREDVKRLLGAVAELNADLSMGSLPGRTVGAVESLIRDTFIGFDSFADDDHFIDQQWNSDPAFLSAEMIEVFANVFNNNPYENPLVGALLRDEYPQALKVSDFLARSEWERTAQFNEFFHPLRVENQMGIVMKVAPSVTIACAVNRGTKDFSERDKTLLTLLRPHLLNSIRNAIRFHEIQENNSHLKRLFELVSHGIVSFDADGRIFGISNLALQLLSKYFDIETANRGFLPDNLRAWATTCDTLNGSEYSLPSASLVIQKEDSELRIDFVAGSDPSKRTLLLEEKRRLSPKTLRVLGLTSREAEILFWISQGKTDEVIATLLSISTRTVQKHVEHILHKLNVETRTGAIRCAIDVLNERKDTREIIL